MKQIKKTLCFFIAIAFLAGGTLFAQGIRFVHDLDSALTMAKAENKPIFIDFYTSWCAPCKVMSNEVFPQEKVGNFFNKNFISCKIQCDDNGVGVELGKKYAVNAYPTTMFLTPGGEMIHSAAGSLSAEEFIDLANIALNPEKNLMSLIKKWNSGQRDTAFVNSYFATLNSAYRYELAKSQFETYFEELTKTEKTSRHSFQLIKLLGFPPFSPLFSFVEDNKKSFYKSTGTAVIDKYITDSYTWYLRSMAMEKGDSAVKAYHAAKAKFKSKNYPNYNEVAMFAEIVEMFGVDKFNIEEYQRLGTAFLDKYGTKNDNYTTALVSLLGNCTGRGVNGSAGIKWMENLMARNNNPRFLHTYCYILWRNYELDKALEVAGQIRNNAISKNESTKEIDWQITMISDLKEKEAKRKAAALQPEGKKSM